MANSTSFRLSAAKGLRLPFTLTGITYNLADPDEHRNKAVTQEAQGTYGPAVSLAGAGEEVIGALLIVEPFDGGSTKGTVDVATGGSVVWFRYTGTAPAIGAAIIGAAGTGGDTGDGFVTTATAPAGKGRVVEVDTTAREVGVIF
jgi:hypothetical protein